MKLANVVNPILLLALGLHVGLLMLPLADPTEQGQPTAESIVVRGGSPATPETSPAPAPAARTAKPAAAPPAATKPATAAPAARVGSSPSPRPASTADPAPPAVEASARPTTAPAAASEATPPAHRPTLTALVSSTAQTLPDSLKQLADWFTQVYTYSEAETTALAETEARQRWIQTLRQEQAMETLMPEALEKPIKLNYPLKSSLKYQRRFMACLSQTPKPVALGVFFDRTGALAEDPALLRGSGYRFLNQEAMEQLKQYPDFPEQKAQKAFTVEVEIDYDSKACLTVDRL